MGSAVLVPLKAFSAGKARLSPALSPADREALARSMAERVVAAAAPLPVYVACDDDQVAGWAARCGAQVIWTPGLGLNGAVQHGVEVLSASGVRCAVVAHGDLPAAAGLSRFVGFAGVTLVPDRRDEGTNVVCLPTDAGFVFAYGTGSFARHRSEVRRLGLPLRVARVPELQWDVDAPEDIPVPTGT